MKKTYKSTISEYSLKYTKSEIQKTKVTTSESAFSIIKQFYFDDINIYESFFILLLNSQNNTTGFAKISQGGTAGTVVDIKIIAKYAVDSLSPKVIICHNHPSGNKQPSDADLNITRRIKDALLLLDIKLIDHIIITENDFYSFADNGNL
jgi:DNA repair protein RadC